MGFEHVDAFGFSNVASIGLQVAENVNLRFDGGFVEMAPDKPSNLSGLSLEVEEWSGAFSVTPYCPTTRSNIARIDCGVASFGSCSQLWLT